MTTTEDTFRLFSSLRYDISLLDISESVFDHAGWNYESRSPFYMLDLHRDRILRAATYWGWEKVVEVLDGKEGLQMLENSLLLKIHSDEKSPMRVKVTFSQDGQLGCEVSPTPATALANLFPGKLHAPGKFDADGNTSAEAAEEQHLRQDPVEVVIDPRSTSASQFTHFKTTHRPMYDAARQRTRIDAVAHKECLLVNEANGMIMEGTISTPYFWRNGMWTTPCIGPTYGVGSGGQDGTTRRWVLER
jgi:4-amino-4-deoxychorismate lyase